MEKESKVTTREPAMFVSNHFLVVMFKNKKETVKLISITV